jgi:rhodanese-related sulfurtransferase
MLQSKYSLFTDKFLVFRRDLFCRRSIDVRTENEFKMERIFGAKNIPLNQIQSKIEELKKLEKIYIYCATGNRSQIACHLLNSIGIENCYNVEGGIEEWKWNNFETEK